jgi:hypothetical protein
VTQLVIISFMERFIFNRVVFGFVCFGAAALSSRAEAAQKVAEIINIRGQVEALGPGGQIRVLSRGAELYEQETVMTGQDGRAKVRFIEGANEVVVGTNSRLQIQTASADEKKPGTTLFLESGEVRSTVNRKYSGQGRDVFEVRTPNAVAGVRGTVFQVGYDRRQNATVVATLRGLVSVQAGGSNPALVAKGQFTMTMRGILQSVRPIDRDRAIKHQIERFERAMPADSDSSKLEGSGSKDAALAGNAAAAAGFKPSKLSEAQALSSKFGFPVESTMNYVKTGTVSQEDKDRAIRDLGADAGGIDAASGGSQGGGGGFMEVKNPTFVQPSMPVDSVDGVKPIQDVAQPVFVRQPVFVKPTFDSIDMGDGRADVVDRGTGFVREVSAPVFVKPQPVYELPDPESVSYIPPKPVVPIIDSGKMLIGSPSPEQAALTNAANQQALDAAQAANEAALAQAKAEAIAAANAAAIARANADAAAKPAAMYRMGKCYANCP